MTNAIAILANNTPNRIERGILLANNGDLFTAVRCFLSAHNDGNEQAVNYLRALRPFCDDLTFGMVALDLISRK